jgi:hypothetical protein
MTDTFNYSLVQNKEGNFVVQSTVKSFNLDHVTQKDIVSFYRNFSNSAAIDTGLLPLDGTGVLSIRSAGNHMQIAIQHAPGKYLINWGAIEGDRYAKTYQLAQPYRIVIGDFVNGNLLGAKMFYSPYPITHPDMPLYHVNLPNINCKGYRGNAVGWICLYLREDWSNISFNEKVSRLIERCSGVETYNDGNMSETDGPRFYQQHQKPSYTYDPLAWEQMTADSGVNWTLNPDLWIPVMVKSIDLQGQHYDGPDAINLTFAGSILGNYQAYYTDSDIPKLYNVMSRSDLNLNNQHVAKIVKSAFALSPETDVFVPKNNPYSFTTEHRNNNGSTQLQISFDDEEEQDYFICVCCQEHCEGEENYNDYNNAPLCDSCAEDEYFHHPTTDNLYPTSLNEVIYSDYLDSYIHLEYDTIITCSNCSYHYAAFGKDTSFLPIYELKNTLEDSMTGQEYSHICKNCIDPFAKNKELQTQKCSCGKNTIIASPNEHFDFTYHSYINPKIDFYYDQPVTVYEKVKDYFCNSCKKQPKAVLCTTCPCGLYNKDNSFDKVNCAPTVIKTGANNQIVTTVTECCGGCLGEPTLNEDGILVGYFEPVNVDLFKAHLNTVTFTSTNPIFGFKQHIDYDAVEF